MKKWKVISFGLGPIGISIARLALSRKNSIEIVGAVDSDKKLMGRDLGDVVGLTKPTGIKIEPTAKGLYKGADLVLHATSSYLTTAKPQLLEFCENKVDTISTCEELSYPWYNHKRIGRELDRVAKKNGVTLLGTGVNPGFVMDALAITLSGVCAKVCRIQVSRVLDATQRRLPFQIKVGMGMTSEEFRKRVRRRSLGHIGLLESIAMTCSAMNVQLDKITQKITPKVATENISTEHFGTILKGRVKGLVQDAKGFSKGNEIASYHIEMYAGAQQQFDEIILIGEPNLSLKILGGTPGDIATSAIVVNSIPRVVETKPGLLTVKDLKPASSVSAP